MKFMTRVCALEDKKIILASQSPRRIEMLRAAGLQFEVCPAEVDESPIHYSDEIDYVRHNALEKATYVWAKHSADLVIAADTIVVKDGRIFEKPLNADDARSTLRILGGAVHEVVTGFCLKTVQQEILDEESTRVTFYPLSEEEIEAYLATGEAYDKAGGYGMQGLAGLFIRKIEGCYYNVVGFPLAKFYQHLKDLQW